MAIDEHRPDFKATLWTRFTPTAPDPYPRNDGHQKVEQRWFVGAHANVGGGSTDDELPQVPLAWLKGKAERLGLAFRAEVPVRGGEHLGPISDSFASFMWGLYRFVRLGRRHQRVIGAATRTVRRGTSDTVNETIDATVFDRWRQDASYRPPGLVEWAARRRTDPAAPTTSIDAKTLAPV